MEAAADVPPADVPPDYEKMHLMYLVLSARFEGYRQAILDMRQNKVS